MPIIQEVTEKKFLTEEEKTEVNSEVINEI